MRTLALDVHGATVAISSEDSGVLDELRKDFAYFAVAREAASAIRFVLRLRRPEPASWGSFRLALRDYRAFDAGPRRRIEYADGARAVYDYAAGEGAIESDNPDRLRELGYLAVLSRAGDELDRRGLHRVHALAFERGGAGGLLVLPCGGGKSSVALELKRRTSFGILAEDTALVDPALRLRAFPLRWGFRPGTDLADVPPDRRRPFRRRRHDPKTVVDLPFYADRVRDAVPLRWLVLGERVEGPAALLPLSAGAAFRSLVGAMVVGVGIAQMSEFCLRAGELPGLARTALRRARAALRISAETEVFRLAMGPAPEAAAEALARALRAREGSLAAVGPKC